MKLSKLIGISFGLLTLLTVSVCEARSHVNVGFGLGLQQPSYAYAPQYIEEYYYPAERVIIHQDPYGRTISEQHVYMAQPVRRAVQVRPVYRERVRPVQTQLSLGFFGLFR